ncbi:MAG: right-handed parallel beta-helix repeat-containing protein [Kiritimatiellaeota bacterium]|nr:right-handed parallel beta-helix repeat-containing protein [Kiritimatiellota bacterium]
MENVDYDAPVYSGNINAGTATVTVTGKGNFTAASTGAGNFTIDKFPVTVTADDGKSRIVQTRSEYVFAALGMVYVAPTGVVATPAFPWDTLEKACPTIQYAHDLPLTDYGTTIVLTNGFYPVAIDTPILITKGITLRSLSGDRDDVSIHGVIYSTPAKNKLLYLNHINAAVCDLTLERGYFGNVDSGANAVIDTLGGTLTNCVIRNGWAGGWDGHTAGVLMNGANALVTHCFITNNVTSVSSGDDRPGAIRMYNGRLEHSLIANNRANRTHEQSPAGVFISGGTIVNCTIAGNEGGTTGGFYTSGGTIINTVIAGNNATQGSGDTVEWAGNAGAESRFANCATSTAAPINATCTNAPTAVLLANVATGNYHAAALSPIIDAGQTLANPPAFDLDGYDRVQGEAIDIGCYESDPSAFTIAFTTDIEEGFIPAQVVFTASVNGVDEDDDVWFYWDFNGNGVTDLATPLFTATNTYGAGVYTVTLTVTNFSAAPVQFATETHADCLKFAPEKIFVNVQSPGAAYPYMNWGTAATNLHEAVEAAVNGCEIIIREGVYELTNRLQIAKALHIHSESGSPESVIITRRPGGNMQLIVMNSTDALLNGVVLHDAYISNNHQYGANLAFEQLGGTVSNCVIRNGIADGHNSSAGIATIHSDYALITHCVITNNSTTVNDQPTNNKKGHIEMSGGRIENCLIADNRSYAGGTVAAIKISGGSIRNCTIADNTSYRFGTFRFDNWSTALFTNCVIAGNIDLNDAGFQTVDGNGNWHDRFADCTIDEEDVNETCFYEEPADTFKNFNARKFQLKETSIAIDRGRKLTDLEIAALPAVDLLGRPRVVNNRLDHGCYESIGRATVLIVR